MTRSLSASLALLLLAAASQALAQEVRFVQPPVGYAVGRIELGSGNSATALAPDPEDENFFYAAGLFDGAPRIVRINLVTGQWTSVCTCPTTVSVSGFAVLSSDVIFVSDNWNNQLLVLHDENLDGDFDDAGEISRLIEPILTHPTWGWTGTSVLVVRSDANRLGLPAGTVLFQSEDGETTAGEILAVVDPLSSPTYQPPGGAYFSGFNYGGGMAIDSEGRLVVVSSFFPDGGKVWICEDISGDGAIGSGESNVILDWTGQGLLAGLSALALDGQDRCYVAMGMGFSTPPRTDLFA